jgi:hypothetical protein
MKVPPEGFICLKKNYAQKLLQNETNQNPHDHRTQNIITVV